jgi:hypothetical protein
MSNQAAFYLGNFHAYLRQFRRRSKKTLAEKIRLTSALFLIFFLINATNSQVVDAADIAPPPELKVAFIGDTGKWTDFENVLNLIKQEGAQLVLHQGDFDYTTNADGFFSVIDSILGPDFPYLASVGNHDEISWKTCCGDSDGCYAQFLIDRMSRLKIIPDDANLNDQKYAVEFQGLKIVLVGSNGNGVEFAQFINNQLKDDRHIWRICSWHANQAGMQVGDKPDEMSWDPYETCLQLGALITTGHMHAYSRTKTLVHAASQTIDPFCSSPTSLCVGPGRSFVIVSGLGGISIYNQKRCLPTNYPYGCAGEWASLYTADQKATYGALFITFNTQNDPYNAHGYFKNVNGVIIDEFDITASSPDIQSHSITTLTPSEDAYVDSKYPDKNFGSSHILAVQGNGLQSSYLKFDLSGLTNLDIKRAMLRLNIADGSKAEQTIRKSEGSWSEGTITYQNRPLTSTLYNSMQGSISGSWVEIDMTYAVRENAGGVMSLRIDSTALDALTFNSREVSSSQPQIVVEYEEWLPLTPSPTASPSSTMKVTRTNTPTPTFTLTPTSSPARTPTFTPSRTPFPSVKVLKKSGR